MTAIHPISIRPPPRTACSSETPASVIYATQQPAAGKLRTQARTVLEATTGIEPV